MTPAAVGNQDTTAAVSRGLGWIYMVTTPHRRADSACKMSADRRRSEKQQVLSKVNSTLTSAGLNDTVWSIRDCDSTLFLLMYKKLVGKLSGAISVPMSAAEHATNFEIVLAAISADPANSSSLDGISAKALADGDLGALQDLADIFSAMCNSLLERSDGRASGVPPPARSPGSAGRPASAKPASNTALPSSAPRRPATAGEATGIEMDPALQPPDGELAPAEATAWEQPSASEATGGAGLEAACASAVVDAISKSRPSKAGRKATPRSKAAGSAGQLKVRPKPMSSAMHLLSISGSLAQHGGARSARKQRPASARQKKGGAIGSLASAQGESLEREIVSLQAKLRARQPDGDATARLGEAIEDEFGARAGSMYAALVKQSLAGVRRAEALEIARGVAADRNSRRKERTERIRTERLKDDVQRSHEARLARSATKQELSYRRLYTESLALEKERMLLEGALAEEGRRKVVTERRKRQQALEYFHTSQLEMLQEQLGVEAQERAFRQRVQTSMSSKLDQESRRKQAAVVRALKAQLDHNEALEYGVPLRV